MFGANASTASTNASTATTPQCHRARGAIAWSTTLRDSRQRSGRSVASSRQFKRLADIPTCAMCARPRRECATVTLHSTKFCKVMDSARIQASEPSELSTDGARGESPKGGRAPCESCVDARVAHEQKPMCRTCRTDASLSRLTCSYAASGAERWRARRDPRVVAHTSKSRIYVNLAREAQVGGVKSRTFGWPPVRVTAFANLT